MHCLSPQCLFYTLLFTLLLMGCKVEEEEDYGDCSTVICTLEFKIVTVTVTNNIGDRVELDHYEVINKANGNDVTPENQFFERGVYPIVTDGMIPLNEVRDLTFIGYINETVVVSGQYKATEECCGVELISGPTQLQIN